MGPLPGNTWFPENPAPVISSTSHCWRVQWSSQCLAMGLISSRKGTAHSPHYAAPSGHTEDRVEEALPGFPAFTAPPISRGTGRRRSPSHCALIGMGSGRRVGKTGGPLPARKLLTYSQHPHPPVLGACCKNPTVPVAITGPHRDHEQMRGGQGNEALTGRVFSVTECVRRG